MKVFSRIGTGSSYALQTGIRMECVFVVLTKGVKGFHKCLLWCICIALCERESSNTNNIFINFAGSDY